MTRSPSPLLAFALGAGLLPASTLAQEAPLTPHQPTLAWQTFRQQHGQDWNAVWNKATGTPKAIFGPGLRLETPVRDLDDARVAAGQLLQQFGELLGRGDSTFVEEIGVKANRVYVLVYRQTYQGLDVISGRADVRIHDTGAVSMFGASAVPIPGGFGLKPTLSAAAARAIAEGQVLGGPSTKQGAAPRLVIWAEAQGTAPTTATLAYEVQIDETPAKVQVGKAYVDAIGGKFLKFENEVYTCSGCGGTHVFPRAGGASRLDSAMAKAHALHTAARPHAGAVALTGTVMAWTNLNNTPYGNLTNVPLANLQVTSSAGNAVTDASGNFSIAYTGTTPVTVTATLTGSHSQRIRVASGTQMSASAVVTPGTPATIQLGTATMTDLDRSQTTTYYMVNDENEWLRSLLPNATTQMNRLSGMNPQVNINSTCNAYYTGFTINFYNAGGSCNMTAFSTVIYHEWGHGADDAFGGISQTDGLSEGWGDILGLYRTDQPVLGAGFFTNGGSVRDGRNTRTYPAGGGVHQQGETWMGFAWDFRENLRAKFGTPTAVQISERTVVASIAANATNQPDAVREVFILDDDDANLNNGTPHYDSLSRAAIKRALPFPKIQLGTLTHTPLQSTTEQLTPQVVRIKAVPISGSFTKVELNYKTGTTWAKEEMVPSGAQDEYIALIPGVLSPATVAYYIEATHNTNAVLRLPESTDNTYSVGKETLIFSDDFEGINKGWTHAQVATQDDWQWGAPQGKSGTSQSVAWSDPAAAASGVNCWGNDLGPTGFNGAYAANVENYLRSPGLVTTGKTGVTLRFKRWLT
ncbi:MAG: hypothetical protein KDC87_06620, partial [Planctomycetes bacterium]|nr:hypothetical protein [Planctomycetota bacterium]